MTNLHDFVFETAIIEMQGRTVISVEDRFDGTVIYDGYLQDLYEETIDEQYWNKHIDYIYPERIDDESAIIIELEKD